MLSQKIGTRNKNKLAILGVLALVMIVLPAFAAGGRRGDLYVSAKAGSTQNGSKTHPYKTIAQAIDKANGRTDIHVSKGEYKENVVLKNGVRLFGEDKDNTVIKAKKDKWSVVSIEENSEINGFTIKDGKRGIWVDKYAKTSIIDCIIKDNEKDGVAIEGGKDTKKENAVYISKTEIKKNGQAGIYSTGERRVIIVDSEILENKSDGVDLSRGTSAWIAENKIKDNKGSGLKLTIDGSNIWTKNNSIRENSREGVEISFFGGAGRIDMAKSKIVDNNLYGIAKLQRANFSESLWEKYLTFGSKVEFWGNRAGNISKVIFIK